MAKIRLINLEITVVYNEWQRSEKLLQMRYGKDYWLQMVVRENDDRYDLYLVKKGKLAKYEQIEIKGFIIGIILSMYH